MQEKSSAAQPDPRMLLELIADLAHAGILAGANADVDIVHSRMEKKQRCMAASDAGRYLIGNNRCSDNLMVSMATSKFYLLGKNYKYCYIHSIKCFRPSQRIQHPRTEVAGHTSPTCRDDDTICPLAARLPTHSVTRTTLECGCF